MDVNQHLQAGIFHFSQYFSQKILSDRHEHFVGVSGVCDQFTHRPSALRSKGPPAHRQADLRDASRSHFFKVVSGDVGLTVLLQDVNGTLFTKLLIQFVNQICRSKTMFSES